jgi:membrane protease YdiL (CAAX protease family)
MLTEMAEEHRPSRAQKFIQFPLVSAIIALMLVAGAVIVVQLVMKPLGRYLFARDDLPMLWLIMMWMLAMLTASLAYYTHVRFIERRPMKELAWSGALSELGIGCSIGAGLIISVIVILWIFGYYHVIAVSGAAFVVFPFFNFVFTAVFEELVFRGIIFRIIEKSLGSWLAIILSGLLFGFAHVFEPNANLFSSLAISLMGGVFFSAAYIYTRRLWIVIGIHFAWNFVEGGILGLAISGKNGKGLLQSEITGSEFISGGSFGPEASIVTILIVLLAGLYLLFKAKGKGHFIRPFWRLKSNFSELHTSGNTNM